MASEICVAMITAPNGDAQKIAEELVKEKLAACVNCIPGIKSTYRWKGKIEKQMEDLLLVKTTRDKVDELNACIESIHPYDMPEVIVLDVANGLPGYLGWVEDVVKQ